MSDEPQIPPVSMRKPGTDEGPSRPRTVQLAAGALALSGLAAIVTALTLLGGRGWLTDTQKKANVKAVSSAVSSASASASKKHADVAHAVTTASASATKKYPIGGSALHSEITQQQRGVIIETILIAAILAFLCFSVYRGRHWSRWGVLGFWFLASFTGTLVGINSILIVGAGSAPASYKAPSFVAGVSLLAAAILVLMKPSGEYFLAHRPPPREGQPERRGLFGPRPGGPQRAGTQGAGTQRGARPPGAPARPGAKSGAKPGVASTAKSALTSSAATRGEAYVERQRAKKRAAANAESVARGAELARNRAKASKSRRIES